MPSTCAIATCPNRSDKTQNVNYYSFPRDKLMKKRWILACKRGDLHFNPDNARICSDHFLETDYVRDLKAELLSYIPNRKKLKESAVPTLNLPEYSVSKENERNSCSTCDFPSVVGNQDSSRQRRFNKREVMKRALNRLDEISPPRKVRGVSANTDSRLDEISPSRKARGVSTNTDSRLDEKSPRKVRDVSTNTDISNDCTMCSNNEKCHLSKDKLKNTSFQLYSMKLQIITMKRKISRLERENKQLKEQNSVKLENE